MTIVLACDIGGTNARMALARVDGGHVLEILANDSELTGGSVTLSEVASRFCKRHGYSPTAVCAGVAGAIHQTTRGQICRMTNNHWEVSQSELQKTFDCPAKLVNDMAANAMGIVASDLTDNELISVKEGEGYRGGHRAVLSPGTGLGKALLIVDGDTYLPVETEGGHVDFAPRTEEQDELVKYLRSRFGRVSAERIACGTGLPNVYAFLRDTGRYPVWEPLDDALAAGDAMAGRLLAEAPNEPICKAVFRIFFEVLGAQASDLVMGAAAFDGVYLGGGILPKMKDIFLASDAFLNAFMDKAPHVTLVEQCPVWLVDADEAALNGALALAARMANRNR